MHLHQAAADGGQLHPPGQGRLHAEGLPVHEVAPAAHRLADHQTHDHQVHQGEEGELPLPGHHHAHDHHGDDRAVDGQTAVPDGHGPAPVEGAIGILIEIQVEDHVVEPGAQDAEGDAPEHRVQHVVLLQTVLLPPAHTERQRKQQACGDEDAVPVDAVAHVDGLGRGRKCPIPEEAGETDGTVRHDSFQNRVPPFCRCGAAGPYSITPMDEFCKDAKMMIDKFCPIGYHRANR